MQGNWNFVWHCLIGWIFFWARGGQLYARTRFIVNLGVCLFFFFFPSKMPQKMPGYCALICNDAGLLVLQRIWKTKSLGPSGGSDLTISTAAVLINQSWLGFSQWAKQHEHSEPRAEGCLSAWLPMGWLTWNLLESSNQDSTGAVPLHMHLQFGGCRMQERRSQ